MTCGISYDAIASSYDQLHGEEQRRKFNLVKHAITGSVLDVGCGTGIVWKEWKGKPVTGIDPSQKLIEQANHITTILGRGELLPFPDKSFDTVTCFTALHNFDDYQQGLEEMTRVAKQKIIVTLLKKSKKRKEIKTRIKQFLVVKEIIDDETDDIFVCEPSHAIRRIGVPKKRKN